jgi:hypothetical protein
MLKDDGYLLITDFSWVVQPKEDFELYGMYTNCSDIQNGPEDFKPF